MISILGRERRVAGWGSFALAGAASLTLLTGFASAESRPRGIPPEAVSFKGHWYALYYEEIHSWPEALQACRNKDGLLAMLESTPWEACYWAE